MIINFLNIVHIFLIILSQYKNYSNFTLIKSQEFLPLLNIHEVIYFSFLCSFTLKFLIIVTHLIYRILTLFFMVES